MTLFDTLAARLGYAKAARAVRPPAPSTLMALADSQNWEAPEANAAEKQAALYAQLTWIATAIDRVAEVGSAAKFSVESQTGPDDEDRAIDNHPFEKLLNRPNPAQSRGEFIRDALSFFKSTGNLYIQKNAADEKSPPDELWVIPSQMMRPIPDGKSYISGYEFRAPGKAAKTYPAWQFVHLKTWNPLNPFVGLSAIQSLALDAYGDLAQQKWNLKLFDKNDGKFPGILAFKHMIGDPEWAKILKQRDTEWGGTNRPGVMMLRGVGDTIQYLQAASTQKEMEFLAGRNFTKEEIFGKLAPGLASILAVNATEANAIAGKATLIEYAVWPMLEQLAQKLTAEVLPLYGDNLVGEFEDMRQTNRVVDLQEQAEFARYHTVNEVRAEYYSEDPLYLEPGMELERVITVRDTVTGTTLPPELPGVPDAPLPDATEPAKAQKADKKMELDPRGFMFASQIGPNTPYPSAKQDTPAPAAMPTPAAPAQPPAQQPPAAQPAQPPEATPAAQGAELKAWEKFAVNHLGRGGREFEARALPLFRATRIAAALKAADTIDKIHGVFEREQEQPDLIEMGQRIEAAILKATERLGPE